MVRTEILFFFRICSILSKILIPFLYSSIGQLEELLLVQGLPSFLHSEVKCSKVGDIFHSETFPPKDVIGRLWHGNLRKHILVILAIADNCRQHPKCLYSPQ